MSEKEKEADYSQTLNLPKTDFPMRGNLPKKEPEMQKHWADTNIYEKVQERTQGRPKFILHDGPPYANGDIHIGHALNKIIKDFIVRFKSMSGYDTPYVPGWDTHGLPIEHAIIKNEKIDRHKVGILEFRDRCANYAHEYIEKQKEQFMRLGVRGDWQNPYLTLKPEYEARQIRVFGEMAKKGYIYKGLKTVYWSPSSETALAEAEIEYQNKRSPSIYVRFRVKEGNGKLDQGDYVIIWTTTPWTIPSNLGIALNPEFEYSLVRVGEERLLLASKLVEEAAKAVGWDSYEIEKTFKGAELEGVVCQHPFYDRESPILFGDHVTLEAGTGCVHTAPGHGEEDFELGKKYGLDILSPVDEKGKFTKEAPGFEGMFYDDANKEVTDKLKEVGALIHLSFIKHQYPHDWRSKKPIIYRATEQWFASIDGFRDELLKAVRQVKWVPSWGEQRLYNMVADRNDWCISRQRVWGVPIPIFFCKNCNHELINDETIGKIETIFRKEGSQAWFRYSEEELLPEGIECPECGHREFRKETDIMDVWFDSGSSHWAVLKEREELQWPADLYLEGSDQYRGWFNSSISTSVAITGEAPYKGVLSHGFTLDGKGRKMSKSLGNVMVPQKIINKMGADILRLWVASVDYQADVRISDDILKQISEAYRKIRNTFRFILGNLDGFDPEANRVPYDQLGELDRYILLKFQNVIQRVTQAYEDYEYHTVFHTIHNFCTIDLSSFYLDISKDRLYTGLPDSDYRRSAQTVLYDVLSGLVKLVSPILAHTADEVWQFIPGQTAKSVQLTDLPQVEPSLLNKELERKWDQLIQIRDEVLKALEEARREKVIGNSLGASVQIYPSESIHPLLQSFKRLDELFIVSRVDLHAPDEQSSEGAMSLEGLNVKIIPADGEKCERCWIVTPEVGHDNKYPDLCKDCADTIKKLQLQ